MRLRPQYCQDFPWTGRRDFSQHKQVQKKSTLWQQDKGFTAQTDAQWLSPALPRQLSGQYPTMDTETSDQSQHKPFLMHKSVDVPAPQVPHPNQGIHQVILLVQIIQTSNKKFHNTKPSLYWPIRNHSNFNPEILALPVPAPSKRKPWREVIFFLIHNNLLPTPLLHFAISTEQIIGTSFLSTPCSRKFRKWEKRQSLNWLAFVLNRVTKKQTNKKDTQTHKNFQNIPSIITASISSKAYKSWFNLVFILHLATLGLCFYSEIKFTEHWKISKKQDVLNTCCTLLKM